MAVLSGVFLTLLLAGAAGAQPPTRVAGPGDLPFAAEQEGRLPYALELSGFARFSVETDGEVGARQAPSVQSPR